MVNISYIAAPHRKQQAELGDLEMKEIKNAGLDGSFHSRQPSTTGKIEKAVNKSKLKAKVASEINCSTNKAIDEARALQTITSIDRGFLGPNLSVDITIDKSYCSEKQT